MPFSSIDVLLSTESQRYKSSIAASTKLPPLNDPLVLSEATNFN